MFGRISRPTWWLLYMFVLVTVGLLVLEHQASLSATGHRLAEVGIALVGFGLILLWFNANDARLRAAEWRAAKGREVRRVVYTDAGRFVMAKSPDPSIPVTAAHATEIAPAEQAAKSQVSIHRTALPPIDNPSSLLPTPVSRAQGEVLGVLNFAAIRRS